MLDLRDSSLEKSNPHFSFSVNERLFFVPQLGTKHNAACKSTKNVEALHWRHSPQFHIHNHIQQQQGQLGKHMEGGSFWRVLDQSSIPDEASLEGHYPSSRPKLLRRIRGNGVAFREIRCEKQPRKNRRLSLGDECYYPWVLWNNWPNRLVAWGLVVEQVLGQLERRRCLVPYTATEYHGKVLNSCLPSDATISFLVRVAHPKVILTTPSLCL